MGGGLMQLVAYGAQDVYLTGNPQITFWKVTYRRHTNFAMESIEQTFNGQADFGRRVTCTISRNGDLAYRTYLQVTLPEINQQMLPANITQELKNPGPLSTIKAGQPLPDKDVPNRTGVYARWLDFPGHQLISMVEVEIGGQRIDRQYGDWMHIWNQLCLTAEQQRGYFKMVGNTTQLTFITDPNFANVDGPCATTAPAQVCAPRNALPETTLYIPFQFWYCRNPGLALPLIALQYHEIRINLDLRPIDECLWAVTSLSAPCASPIKVATAYQQSLVAASLYVDYVFLDTDERRRMAQNPHEYLIEQLQFTGDESVGSSSNKIKLNFNHPCKELIWVVQPDANVDYCASLICSTALFDVLGAQPFNYTDAIDSLPNAIHAFGGPASLTFPQPSNAVITSTGRFQDAGADDVYNVFGWNMQYPGFLPSSAGELLPFGGNYAIPFSLNPNWPGNQTGLIPVIFHTIKKLMTALGGSGGSSLLPGLVSHNISKQGVLSFFNGGGLSFNAGCGPLDDAYSSGDGTGLHFYATTSAGANLTATQATSVANMLGTSDVNDVEGISAMGTRLSNAGLSSTSDGCYVMIHLYTAAPTEGPSQNLITLVGGLSAMVQTANMFADILVEVGPDQSKTFYLTLIFAGSVSPLANVGGLVDTISHYKSGVVGGAQANLGAAINTSSWLAGANAVTNGSGSATASINFGGAGGAVPAGYGLDSGDGMLPTIPGFPSQKSIALTDVPGPGALNPFPGSTVSDAGTFVLNETSLDMHCWGENPVVTAKLQLNGQDRFSEREGTYFDLVQPYQHHTRNPDTGINVYSFALRPEEHQPSGTCNFSRIDNATLQLVLSNATVGGTNTAKVRVYATNYNVLRIMSGMGGLAYSN